MEVTVTPTFLFLCIGDTTLQFGCLPLIINLLYILAQVSHKKKSI